MIQKKETSDKHNKAWHTIYQHSMAKRSKLYAEQCFAPYPLPEEIDQKFTAQIETTRDLLLEMLFEHNQTNQLA